MHEYAKYQYKAISSTNCRFSALHHLLYGGIGNDPQCVIILIIPNKVPGEDGWVIITPDRH